MDGGEGISVTGIGGKAVISVQLCSAADEGIDLRRFIASNKQLPNALEGLLESDRLTKYEST